MVCMTFDFSTTSLMGRGGDALFHLRPPPCLSTAPRPSPKFGRRYSLLDLQILNEENRRQRKARDWYAQHEHDPQRFRVAADDAGNHIFGQRRVYRRRALFDDLRGRVWRVFEKNRLCDTESNGTAEELRERGHRGGLREEARCVAELYLHSQE